jgi:trans-aconitate methyltransferase
VTFSIYRYPAFYRLAMRVAYRRGYRDRYARLADEIAAPSRVVEVCCGDLVLHDELHRRGVLVSYRGIDGSPRMVAYGRDRGVRVEHADVRTMAEIPRGDVVILQASLYQFHATAESLLARLWAAAERQLVVAEPVHSLTTSSNRLVSSLGRLFSQTEEGAHLFRYTEPALRALYERGGVPMTSVRRAAAGREVIVSSVRESAVPRLGVAEAHFEQERRLRR